MDAEDLKKENFLLRSRIAELEKQLSFLNQHKTLARGISGEKLISDVVGGVLTLHTAPFDVETPSGLLVEVKNAKISRSSKGFDGGRRWQWQKVFGETNSKVYDFLILIGDADHNHSQYYKEPDCPFVIFLVPYDQVFELTTNGTRGARGILLTTNPLKGRGKSAKLFSDYAISVKELEEKLGLVM